MASDRLVFENEVSTSTICICFFKIFFCLYRFPIAPILYLHQVQVNLELQTFSYIKSYYLSPLKINIFFQKKKNPKPAQAMEDGSGNGRPPATAAAWNFESNGALLGLTALSVRGVLGRVKAGMAAGGGGDGGGGGGRAVIPMGHGDPSVFPCFRTTADAVDAVAAALRSGEHNSYSSCVGLEPARR